MPHIDIRYQPDLVREESIVGVVDDLIDAVARHFQENPAFVSLEVSPQHAITRNRKAVDIEVDSSPDPGGVRAAAVPALANELAKLLGAHLESQDTAATEVSAWVRIFSASEYHYHRIAGDNEQHSG